MSDKIDRRQALAAFGAVSLGSVLAACGADEDTAAVTTTGGDSATVQARTPTSAATAKLFDASAACALTPQMTEGPYYFDVDSIRSDIREDREGAPLRLAIRVRGTGSCEPLENAVVDIWHCDAIGEYSGFEAAVTSGAGGPPGPPPAGGGGPPGPPPAGGGSPSGVPPAGGGGRTPTDKKTYLRGAQVTNADGVVDFKTVYPGWYRGRTVHIHTKVHLDRATMLTTQLFFDEDLNAAVFARAPYSRRTGRDMFNDRDGIFDKRLVMTTSKDGDGYLGVMTFDVQSA